MFLPPSRNSLAQSFSESQTTEASNPLRLSLTRPAAACPRPLPPLLPSPFQTWLRRRRGKALQPAAAWWRSPEALLWRRNGLTQGMAAAVVERRPRAQDVATARQPRERGTAAGRHGHARAAMPCLGHVLGAAALTGTARLSCRAVTGRARARAVPCGPVGHVYTQRTWHS